MIQKIKIVVFVTFEPFGVQQSFAHLQKALDMENVLCFMVLIDLSLRWRAMSKKLIVAVKWINLNIQGWKQDSRHVWLSFWYINSISFNNDQCLAPSKYIFFKWASKQRMPDTFHWWWYLFSCLKIILTGSGLLVKFINPLNVLKNIFI